MLTSKQRAQLRGLASTMESILTVGKGGMSEQLIKQASDALLKRALRQLPRRISGMLSRRVRAFGKSAWPAIIC